MKFFFGVSSLDVSDSSYQCFLLIFWQLFNHQIKVLHLHVFTIGLPKCVFTVSELKFLGHKLSSSSCSPLEKHPSTISSFPPPSDKPALQRFLGRLNFYRKFIKNAALILAPLTNTLKGPGKLLNWTLPLDEAFPHAGDLLFTVPVLVQFVPGAPFSLAVDASDTYVLEEHSSNVCNSPGPP